MSLFHRPAFWKALAVVLFTGAIAVFLAACSSAIPAFQADIEDIRQDQAASAEAAAEGDWIRASISGLLALAGSVVYAVGRHKKYDRAPFEGTVGGEKVEVTEDELVKAVVLAKKDGRIA